ncbi:MAG TPA: efflux RND transporter permease subunit [Thermoanaerobaculia bacterium]|nr:efflux RND transporter permease subunit [Thermoanaerobaculia bacterium]HUM29630.1 efflux RND transporter permease subunit [Thermoanaerobaculia bacterium]HXK67281.1 efflux RND transporter permease subunit [Thermoanaerobaculia bacterium]
MKITDLAIKNRTTTFVLTLSIMLLGWISYVSLPREASPDIQIPFVLVQTFYSGVSPEDIESLITNKIETELQGIDKVKEIRSASQEGFSSISVEFEPNIDLDTALQKVRDGVNRAKPELPQDVDDPIVLEINFSTFPIMVVNMTAPISIDQLKDIGEDLSDLIETVPGVLRVDLAGGLTRQINIFVDPARLSNYRISLQDIVDTISDEHLNIPGGDLDVGDTNFLIRVPGELKLSDRFRDLVIKAHGSRVVRIGDVARVEYSFEKRSSYSRFNGEESISLMVRKRTGENIIEIADRVKTLLSDQQSALPEGLDITITSDESEMVHNMVRDLENNIISGLILVVLVLFVVMGFRNALLVGLAIPMSMLLSFMIIEFFGMTLNFVVLFSLILALGMLVDNAIVIVENIYRHREEGLSLIEAARKGTHEVGIAVFVSTLTTLAAFFPMVFWPGIMGEFMKYLPFTVIITLSSSLFVALVINPTICSTTMKITAQRKEQSSAFTDFYTQNLSWVLDHPRVTVMGFVAFLLLTLVLYPFLSHGTEFFPDVEPNFFLVDVNSPPGTSLEATDSVVRQVESAARELPDLESLTAASGAGAQSDFFTTSSQATDQGRVTVDLLDRKDRKQNSFRTLELMRERLKEIPGAEFKVESEQHGPPTGPPINVEISGEDYELLGSFAQEIRDILSTVKGVEDIRDDYDSGRPEIRVRVLRDKAAMLDLKTRDIASTIRTAIHGTDAGEFRVGTDEYDITVMWDESFRKGVQYLDGLIIHHEGKEIPLSNVAVLERTTGLVGIRHKNTKRVVTISADVAGRSHYAGLKDAQTAIASGLSLPAGYVISYTGENEEQEKTQVFISKALLYALILISLILITEFNSAALPLIILTSVIMSMAGVLWGLILTGHPFGILMTGIGIISLAGVVVNNAIVLLDYAEQLLLRGLSLREAVLTASTRRLRPVLLTAITTILGLIPLSTGLSFDFHTFTPDIGGEGSQWWGPMGMAVIFGLLFATALTLIMVPSLYFIIKKRAIETRKESEDL